VDGKKDGSRGKEAVSKSTRKTEKEFDTGTQLPSIGKRERLKY